MQLLAIVVLMLAQTVSAKTEIYRKGRSLAYSTSEAIHGIQFSHNNCDISLDDSDHDMSHLKTSERIAILLDLKGGKIQPGSGKILQISDDCEIDDIIVSSADGHKIDHTYIK